MNSQRRATAKAVELVLKLLADNIRSEYGTNPLAAHYPIVREIITEIYAEADWYRLIKNMASDDGPIY